MWDGLLWPWGVAGVVVPRLGGGAGLVGAGRMGFCDWYVCAEGVVDFAKALWMMRRVVEKPVMPLGRVL